MGFINRDAPQSKVMVGDPSPLCIKSKILKVIMPYGNVVAPSWFPHLSIFLIFLCLRFSGLPGDGGWNELKWNVAMVSVSLGNCKQGLQWCSGGWAQHNLLLG